MSPRPRTVGSRPEGRGRAGANGSPPRTPSSPSSSRAPHRPPDRTNRPAPQRARERRPPGAMTPALRPAVAGPGRRLPGSPGPAHLSRRRDRALHRGDVPLHVGLAAPHRANDLTPKAREARAEAHSGLRLHKRSARKPVTQRRRRPKRGPVRVRVATALCATPTSASLPLRASDWPAPPRAPRGPS